MSLFSSEPRFVPVPLPREERRDKGPVLGTPTRRIKVASLPLQLSYNPTSPRGLGRSSTQGGSTGFEFAQVGDREEKGGV